VRWEQSPFLGNGWMGTMIYRNGTNDRELRVDVHHAGVSDRRPGESALFGQARLPIGAFIVSTRGAFRGADWRLDLWNAELTGTLLTATGTVTLRAWVHAEDMVTQVELTPDAQEAVSVRFEPAPAISPRANPAFKRSLPPNYQPNPAPVPGETNGTFLCRQPLLAGGEHATAWTFAPRGPTQVLRFSTARSFPDTTAADEAVSVLNRTASVPADQWLAAHRAYWHALYPRSFVSVSDPFWESFYLVQRYKMACATRADRALIDNHGPWLQETPWPGAWWNLNVQLTYWPFYAAGHLDEARSLPNHLSRHAATLQNNVAPPYRADSAGIGRATSDQLEGSVGTPGGRSAEVGNLPWALHNVWLHYRHTMDDSLLRDPLFPLLRRSVNYYRHFLTNGADGHLHLPATHSPEYGEAPDCNYDLSLLRWGCQTLLWINDRLSLNDPLAPEWRRILDTLAPFPESDTEGFLIGAGVPYATSHRHFSHLMMIYPLHLVTPDQPGGRERIERSIAHWHSKPEALLGYSFTGSALMFALLGDGNRALEKLNGLRRFLTPTTMYRESGPVIETPLSAAQAVHEFLLQNWGGTLRVFPALPAAWNHAVFDRLRAEGAFEVSAESRNGVTQWVRVKSLAGEPVTLRSGLDAAPRLSGSGAARVKELAPGVHALTLKPGEEVTLARPGVTPRVLPVTGEAPYRFGLP
jgi:hypothetical protein